jgi:hypothetical protein
MYIYLAVILSSASPIACYYRCTLRQIIFPNHDFAGGHLIGVITSGIPKHY